MLGINNKRDWGCVRALKIFAYRSLRFKAYLYAANHGIGKTEYIYSNDKEEKHVNDGGNSEKFFPREYPALPQMFGYALCVMRCGYYMCLHICRLADRGIKNN